jgi:hypothetical protein
MKTNLKLATQIGAGVGLLVFITVGAIPGLLYGGYTGLMMAGALFGVPVEPTILIRAITGGGMLLGLLASLSLFLVIGAVIGTGCGYMLWQLVPFTHKLTSRLVE